MQIARSADERAAVLCKEGLVQLGEKYYSNEVIDDTDQLLFFADLAWKDKNFKSAAMKYCSVLESRWQIYLDRIERDAKRANSHPDPSSQPTRARCAGSTG